MGLLASAQYQILYRTEDQNERWLSNDGLPLHWLSPKKVDNVIEFHC